MIWDFPKIQEGFLIVHYGFSELTVGFPPSWKIFIMIAKGLQIILCICTATDALAWDKDIMQHNTATEWLARDHQRQVDGTKLLLVVIQLPIVRWCLFISIVPVSNKLELLDQSKNGWKSWKVWWKNITLIQLKRAVLTFEFDCGSYYYLWCADYFTIHANG